MSSRFLSMKGLQMIYRDESIRVRFTKRRKYNYSISVFIDPTLKDNRWHIDRFWNIYDSLDAIGLDVYASEKPYLDDLKFGLGWEDQRKNSSKGNYVIYFRDEEDFMAIKLVLI